MATILTKRSNTASSVPVAGDLTNSTGGAELAVNTADKRLFTKDSGGTVVELGTNPSSVTLPNGTANGVPYLNGSKVLTSGSALTFDGTTLSNTNAIKSVIEGAGINATNSGLVAQRSTNDSQLYIGYRTTPDAWVIGATYSSTGAYKPIAFAVNDSEKMRLTSTGLGIGTSSPASKLQVTSANGAVTLDSGTGESHYIDINHKGSYNSVNGIRFKQNSTTYGNNQIDFLAMDSGGTVQTVMTLNGSGNLGLGVTPSASNLGKALQITNASFVGYSNNAYVGANWYYGSGDKYIANGFASLYAQDSSVHKWYTAPSGTAGNAISFTQAMTLDASGRLGLGVTSPAQKFQLNGAIGFDNTAGATFQSNLDYPIIFSSEATGSLSFNGHLVLQPRGSAAGAIIMATGSGAGAMAERARIDSSGNLLVGTTTTYVYGSSGSGSVTGWDIAPNGGGNIGMSADVTWNRYTTGSVHGFRYNGSPVGAISISTTATTYATSSDYRLKEDIQPMTGALAKVAQLKPVTYKWNADGSDGEGFIAHELAEVCPQAVTGEKDAVDADGNPVYQGIDTSFLVATLTAAIQELKAEVDSLKSEINTLKGI